MRIARIAATLFFAISGPSAQAQENSMPEEYRTLISAYTVGRLSLGNLRDTCKWRASTSGVREDLAYARRQNSQFCEGFISGVVEFTRLDAAALSRIAGSDLDQPPQKCGSASVATLRAQLLTSPERNQKRLASDALIAGLLGCER